MRGPRHGRSYGPPELLHYDMDSQDWRKLSCKPQSRMQLEPVAEGETREFVIQQEIRIFLNPRRAAADGRWRSAQISAGLLLSLHPRPPRSLSGCDSLSACC